MRGIRKIGGIEVQIATGYQWGPLSVEFEDSLVVSLCEVDSDDGEFQILHGTLSQKRNEEI